MERSFKKEIEALKLGEGDLFEGEGILAVTKALLQSGVSYVGGYQGSPVSNLLDVMVQAKDGTWSQAVVSMTSTQLKKSRRWNSLMLTQKVSGPSGSFTPPTYAVIYKLSTVSESNDRGSWFGYQVEKAGQVEDADIYNEAKSFSTAASRGDVEAKPTVEGEPVKEAPKSNNTESNEDVPF